MLQEALGKTWNSGCLDLERLRFSKKEVLDFEALETVLADLVTASERPEVR